MADINNMEDMLDVRDIIARVEELEGDRESLIEAVTECWNAPQIGDATAYSDALRIAKARRTKWEEENLSELEGLASLLDDLKGYGGDEQWRGDWYPVTLIRDSHFVTAMQELCEDIGDFPNGVPDYYVIDWKATARNLRVDYSTVDYDGVEYLYR